MSGRDLRLPRLSRIVLEWAARRLGIGDLPGDAAELFAERALHEGQRRARRWYRRQTRAALGRLTRSRVSALSWGSAVLDAKLGLRMLVKHPGVTVVGGAAMAIGIGLGAAYLELVDDFVNPVLPFPNGDQIVGLRNWDLVASEPELRAVHDFVAWRESLEAVHDLGAFRSVDRNFRDETGAAEPSPGAQISASAFRIVGVAPAYGRPLVDSDERAGAPPVVVLGYSLWESRFLADPDVVGREIRIGTAPATVVGIMPEGFAFPVSHEFWTPLRAEQSLQRARREGPPIQVFGRLAPGSTLDEAQAELAAIGSRAALEHPETHAQLRPQVMKYTELFVGGDGSGEAYLGQIPLLLLLLVLSSNVATMVLARTASRENEIALRFALGARRGQILAQFFAEALVLALVAAAVGLAVVAWGTHRITRLLWEITDGQVPFWVDQGMNGRTLVYALVLAVVGACVAGVMPALRATTGRLQSRLRHSAGQGGSVLRLGGRWGGLIAMQVAFAVLVIPPAVVAIPSLAESGWLQPGFDAEQYLSARLELEFDPPSIQARSAEDSRSRFTGVLDELRRRLLEEPEVSHVTFATRLPGMNHPQPVVELDTVDGQRGAGSIVMPSSVDASFFDAFGAEILAGRGFNSADLEPGPGVVVVNEHFVAEQLQGQNAIGRRIRYSSLAGQRYAIGLPHYLPRDQVLDLSDWYEIVGVVRDPGMDTSSDPFWPGWGPGIYHPLADDAMGWRGSYSVRVALHLRGNASASAGMLRAAAQSVNPDFRLYDVLPLDRPVDNGNRFQALVTRVFAGLTGVLGFVALLISAAGVYSIMSFTVSCQTREIAIRIALGANRRRILAEVFARALFQIVVGILAGTSLWSYLIVFQLDGADQVGLLISAAAVLLLIGLVACGVPVRRALRIQPARLLSQL